MASGCVHGTRARDVPEKLVTPTTTVFPSAAPVGRRDVKLLGEWLTEMLRRLYERDVAEEELVQESQTILSVAYRRRV